MEGIERCGKEKQNINFDPIKNKFAAQKRDFFMQTRDSYRFYKKIHFLNRWTRRIFLWPIKREIFDILEKIRPAQVLDIGCGDGEMMKNIKKIGAHLIGVDSSPAMISLANKKKEHSRIIQSDARKIPFLDNQFDGVIISLVLHELKNNDGKKIVQEAARVIKKGGVLVVVDFQSPKKPKFLSKLLRLLFAQEEKMIGKIYPDHYKNYLDFLKHDLMELISGNNLTAIRRKSVWLENIQIIVCHKSAAR